jgi:hypothetical protein
VNLEKGRGFWGGLGLEKMKGKRSETMFVCFGSYDVLLLLLFGKCSNTGETCSIRWKFTARLKISP